jgi:hypothetical protein
VWRRRRTCRMTRTLPHENEDASVPSSYGAKKRPVGVPPTGRSLFSRVDDHPYQLMRNIS